MILTPGTTGGLYENQTTDLFVDDAITLTGEPGQPRPVIPSSGANGIFVGDSATVQDLQVDYTQTGAGLFLQPATGTATAERVIINSTSGGDACELHDSVIRSSICRATTDGRRAVQMSVSGVTNQTGTLRNVTAIAPGASSEAIRVNAGNGADLTLNAGNTIASGGLVGSSGADVEATTNSVASTSATVDLAASNYDTESETGTGASVTDPATFANQTAAPQFVNAAAGDFHQLATSPTIDMGLNGITMLGTLDIDGNSRFIDGNCEGTNTVDVGADEFVPSCPGPSSAAGPVPEPEAQAAPDGAPDTQITDGPEGKVRQRSATIAFNGTDARAVVRFECKLDGGAFETCTSPKTYSGLKKGDHTVQVRAIDDAGNVDPTPATRSWKVKKRKRRN